jgi:hypothetical protein
LMTAFVITTISLSGFGWLSGFGSAGLAIAEPTVLVADNSSQQPTEQLTTTLRQDLSQRLSYLTRISCLTLPSLSA